MKRLKSMLCAVLALLLVCGALPLGGVLAAPSAAAERYAVWQVIPSGEDGSDMTHRHEGYIKNFGTVAKQSEDGKAFARVSYPLKGVKSNGSTEQTVVASACGNTLLPWLDNIPTLEAVDEYLTLRFDYRISGLGEGVKVMLYAAAFCNWYSGHFEFGRLENVADTAEWTSVEIKVPDKTFFRSWYSGAIGFWPYLSGHTFADDVTLDLRNVRLTLDAADADAINAKLQEAGSTETFETLTVHFGEDVTADPIFEPVWAADPSRLPGEAGESVWVDEITGTVATNGSATKQQDDDGWYYKLGLTITQGSGGGDQVRVVFHSGYTAENLPWLADKAVLKALKPYLNISYEFRFTGLNEGKKTYLYFRMLDDPIVVKSDDAAQDISQPGSFGNVTDWQSVGPTQIVQTTDANTINWEKGWLVFAPWGGSALIDETSDQDLTLELRNMQMFLDANRKEAIDAALEGTDWTYDKLIEKFQNPDESEPPEEPLRDFTFLFVADPGAVATNPYYSGNAWSGESFNSTWSRVNGGEMSALRFNVTATEGSLNVYGNQNKRVTAQKYFNTAYLEMYLRLQTASADRTVKIGTESGDLTKYHAAEIGEDWTRVLVPLKEIAARGSNGYLRILLDGRQVGDVIDVGNTVVWSHKPEGDMAASWARVLDMSGYEKHESNTQLGLVGDTTGITNPWNETRSASYGATEDVMEWDLAWYYNFQNLPPWIVTPHADRFDLFYLLTFYPDSATAPSFDVSGSIDTGYVEFYVWCDTDGVVIPFTFESFGNSPRLFAPVYVKYEAAKARPDGYLQVRVPFTYLADMGLDMTQLGRVNIRGYQETIDCNYFLLSSFRYYDQLADVADPEPIVEPEPPEERDIPFDIDSSILNAYLDRENGRVLIPEGTRMWELLAAMKFDTDESRAEFFGNGAVLEDENTVLTDQMTLVLYRRDYYLTQLPLVYLTRENVPAGATQPDATQPGAGGFGVAGGERSIAPVYWLTAAAALCAALLFCLRKRLFTK